LLGSAEMRVFRSVLGETGHGDGRKAAGTRHLWCFFLPLLKLE
jgi:hypothetical protein